jgi:flagellar motor component MotA
MGDIFRDISGSTIINRSTIEGAVNTLTGAGETDVAEALKKVAELVEQSGDHETAELYDAFAEEVQQEQPRKSVLRSTWTALKSALPALAQAAAVAGLIDKFVTG